MEPKDTHNETASVPQPKTGKESPEPASLNAQPASASSSERKASRQTASANPISPDDLLGAPAQSENEGSWIPLAAAFAVGLVAGLIAGVLIERD